MRVQLRIVAGNLRGRKLVCVLHGDVRPTPQMVREALFSILGDAVPDRPFVDVFAGTGVVGLEALSRGASEAVFIERDVRLAADIEGHLRNLQVGGGRVLRADVYRWAERWTPPGEPVNVFISPPFADFERRLDALVTLLADLQHKAAPGSVLVLQGEHKHIAADQLPESAQWEERRYGRNLLLIWVKEASPQPPAMDEPHHDGT
jgi:16S rRNA (guanine(966)-N(2))-methyltransferase RsmD